MRWITRFHALIGGRLRSRASVWLTCGLRTPSAEVLARNLEGEHFQNCSEGVYEQFALHARIRLSQERRPCLGDWVRVSQHNFLVERLFYGEQNAGLSARFQ